MVNFKARKGSQGEDVAMQWLRDNGYYIVERNWRSGHYEIDIVAQRWDTLHIVEVRTRHISSLVPAAYSLDKHKRESLRRAAALYRAKHYTPLLVQVDLIAITVDDYNDYTIDYIERIV